MRCSVVLSLGVVGCCPVLYPGAVLPSGLRVHPRGPIPADVVGYLGLAFCLCSDWPRAGCSHVHGVLCPTFCQFRAGSPHCRDLLLQLAKTAMEALYPGAAEQQCCRSTARMLPPLRWRRVDSGPCCQGSGAGLAQLPSAGSLQIFMAVFKSKTRFIKQLGLRKRPFFGNVSGAGVLQGLGQCLQHRLTLLP